MTIQDVYTKYLTPRNLQEHMLRVAALSHIILEHWHGETVDPVAITNVCLLHDIAKPLTFELSAQSRYETTPQEIENIIKFQKTISAQYGGEEHDATLAICKAEGCSQEALRIMGAFEWKEMEKIVSSNDRQTQVVLYCDMRIGPSGIVPIQDRIDNLQARYGVGRDYELFSHRGHTLEVMVQDRVHTNLQAISEGELHELFPILMKRNIRLRSNNLG